MPETWNAESKEVKGTMMTERGCQMTAEVDLKMGDLINTDYGIVRVAAFRDEDDGPEVGFVVDGQMGWASIDYVTLVVRE